MTDIKAVDYSGLSLWNKVEKTDPKYTKRVNYGKRTFTTVDAYSQVKTATSLWGSYGGKWGFKDVKISFQDVSMKDGIQKICIFEGIFYYPGGEFPVINAIKISDDEFLKKIYTDSLTKALSYLGFNADIFLGLFDDARYVNELKKEFSNNQIKPTQEAKQQAQAQPQNEQPKADNDGLEILKKSGVAVKQENGRLVASGKTYQNSSLLKKLGFKWDSSKKVWIKEISKVA